MQIKALPRADAINLLAAQGWLELGNHLEANAELEKITPEFRIHPDVLELRWQVHAVAKKWEVCLDIAGAIINLAPERVFGWLHRSFALHELKRTQEAFENLIAAAPGFPMEWVISYNLACYACQLGNLEDARQWLKRAFELGGESKIKLQALDDKDLEPLWREIGRLK